MYQEILEAAGCRQGVLIYTPSFYRIRGDVPGDPEAAGCRQGVFTWIQDAVSRQPAVYLR